MAASDEGTIGVDGTIEWRDERGELHRDGGPAVEHANGSVKFYPDGRKAWFTEGVKVREERPS